MTNLTNNEKLERLYEQRRYLQEHKNVKMDFLLTGAAVSLTYMIGYKLFADPSLVGNLLSAGGVIAGGVVGSYVDNRRLDNLAHVENMINKYENQINR